MNIEHVSELVYFTYDASCFAIKNDLEDCKW